MSTLKKYIEYLKDNPNHYWFKRKIWGWGWTPATWQGWCATFLYIFLVIGLVLIREEDIPGNPDSGSNFLTFALPLIVLTILFLVVAYKKGEKPRWQWGVPAKGEAGSPAPTLANKLKLFALVAVVALVLGAVTAFIIVQIRLW